MGGWGGGGLAERGSLVRRATGRGQLAATERGSLGKKNERGGGLRNTIGDSLVVTEDCVPCSVRCCD